MKTFKILIFLLLLKFSALAQVQGKVVTVQGVPLPFVNVLLLNPNDSTMISGSLSADDGNFSITGLQNGKYMLRLTLLGYENWYSPVFTYETSQPLKDFGTLSLSEETMLMEGVLISAQKMQIEQGVEGTTLNLGSSMMSRGSSALQILEKAPGVVLDQRNNELILNGKSGTLIMINGRPVRMAPNEIISLLQGMSADNLEKVELLTNPSAKYDADGNAGIINIVTKKEENEGTNGSASLTAGYGWGPKQALNLSLNRRKGSTNYYGSYSFNYDHFFTDFHGIGSQTIPVLGGGVNFDFKNNSERKISSHNATVGFEKELANGILWGGNVLYNSSITNTNINNTGKYIFESGDFLHADINVTGRAPQNNLNTSLFAEKRLKNDGKINFDANYIYYNNNSPTRAESSYLDENGNIIIPENEIYSNGIRGKSETDINIGVAKLDFEKNINPNIKLETGLKATYSVTTNDAIIERLKDNFWIADERNKSSLEVIEKIGASYLSLHFSIDSLTKLSTGLRYEYWDRDFSEDDLDKKGGQLFPSAFLTRTLNATSSLQLVYNRRITRPDYNDLTNFLRYNDPTSVFTGTPNLQPAISENVKLGYQFAEKNISLVFSHESDPIARYQITENGRSDLVVIAPQNVDYIRSLGIQTHLPFDVTRWWNLSTGGTISNRQFRISYTRVPVTKNYIAYNLYFNNNFTLPKDFAFELSGVYNSGQYNGSVEVEGFGMLNFGLKKNLKNNLGTLQFTVTDVLKSMVIYSKYGALTEEAFNSRASVEFNPESAQSRIFRISWSKNFGNIKSKGFKQRQSGSQEEKSRIGQ